MVDGGVFMEALIWRFMMTIQASEQAEKVAAAIDGLDEKDLEEVVLAIDRVDTEEEVAGAIHSIDAKEKYARAL